MNKPQLSKPIFIMLFGFPGSGKSFFAKQFAQTIGAALVQDDRVRHELFDQPSFDKREDEIVTQLMDYMAEEFLRAGLSVVYDTNALRISQRHNLRQLANRAKAQPLLIWLQIDLETAVLRVTGRDGRKNTDKFARKLAKSDFEDIVNRMQNPVVTEDYAVISGKHTYNAQNASVMKKLINMGLSTASVMNASMIKPELVNLVPNNAAGRVDISRRNISIR